MKKFTLFDKRGRVEVIEDFNFDEAIQKTKKINDKNLDFYHEGDDCSDYFKWDGKKWNPIKNLKNLFK